MNLVQSGHATQFLVIASVRTEDQLVLQQAVNDFKSSLLKDTELIPLFSSAYVLDSFHATKDFPQVRQKFYSFIATLEVKLDVMVVEKLKCFETLQRNPGSMYGIMIGQLIKNLCHQTPEVEVIFSRKDSKLKLQKELEIEVDRIRLEYLQKNPTLNSSVTLSYHHNPHYSHAGLQVADYVAYAVFQVFERRNHELYDLISHKIGRIHDICNKKLFTRSNPLQLSS